MIIDAHVHYTPPSLRDRLHGLHEPYWQHLLGAPESIQGWVSAETMIAAMDAAGIDKIVLVGEYFRQHDNCVMRNNQALTLAERYPNRIIPYSIINPLHGAAAISEARRCLAAGMAGIGELNPYAQGFRLSGPTFDALAALCVEFNVPINLHVGEPVGDYYRGKSSTPLHAYYDLAARWPQLKLILAHWGGGMFLYELMPRVRRRLRHVWYDTAASPLLYPTKRIFATALSVLPADKIVYGSDYPLRVYPSKQSEPDFGRFLQAINRHVPDADARRAILGGTYSSLCEFRPAVESAATALPQSVAQMPVATVLAVWPESAAIFGRFGLPTDPDGVPSWEPVDQAAAAAGLSETNLTDLLSSLHDVVTLE